MARQKVVLDPEKLFFALDIGTRSIVGMVCYPENEKLRVLASEVAYHPQRDMLDGQIHNIEGVVHTVRQVKTELEKRLDTELQKVAIAAAGRALKTSRYLAEREVDPGQKIQKELISSLELEAVGKAREKLQQEEGTVEIEPYYCVGYSAVSYFLDGYPITSLTGQRAQKAGVQVLATFLPQVVVDSLLTVVEELGLSVLNLTLEPIAALHVTIPPEYRSLNLALVDIGAGTSDIALTHKGSVTGYAMVPVAGDEITETLAEHFLLDFNTAEELKLRLEQNKEAISFKDILGNPYKLSAEEIIQAIEPAVEKVATEIAGAILHYNNGPPRAIFCIGGGSKTPLLKEKLSRLLDLPPEMTAVRGREVLKDIVYSGKKLLGPESITPFGIAVSALRRDYFGFSYVTVNDRVVRLLDTASLKVGNALVAAGYQSRKLIGRRGPSLRVHLNGEEKMFPGCAGENARILVNGQEASLDTAIKNNDRIEIVEAEEGAAPEIRVKDLLAGEKPITVYFNGEPVTLSPFIKVNGAQADEETLLQEGGHVDVKPQTLRDLLRLAELEGENCNPLVNDMAVSPDYLLQQGDRVEVKFLSPPSPPLAGENEPRETNTGAENPKEGINKENITVSSTDAQPKDEIQTRVRVNGEEISLHTDCPPSFVDVFNYINFDRSKPQGKLVMTHNGEPASLTGELQDGDELHIYWEKA